jgi:hypothetical protein
MIPDLQASLVCEDVRVEVSGAHTIVGVINGIAAQRTPVRILKLCVWTRWCSGVGNYVQDTRIICPDEETVLQEVSTEFRLADSDGHVTNVNVFHGLEFQQTGNYHVELSLDGELRMRYPMRVFVPKPPAEAS